MVSYRTLHQRCGRILGVSAAIVTAMRTPAQGQTDEWDDFGSKTWKSPWHGRCLLEITGKEGSSRDLVCTGLPPTIPFGEPFTVETSKTCKSLQRRIASLCGLGTVVSARPTTAAEAHRRYPNASKIAESSCTQVKQLASYAEPAWSYYQFTDATQKICQRRAASQAGETSCPPACDYDELNLPPGSLARTIGDLCVTRGMEWHQAVRKAIKMGIRSLPTNADRPGASDVVVHLRVGDVVDYAGFSVEQLLASQRVFYPNEPNSQYVKTLSFYKSRNMTDFVRKRTVVLVAAAHAGWNATVVPPLPIKSCLYVHSIKDFFMELGAARVELRIGNTPDEDMYFMSQAKFLVPSGGGYSRVAACFVMHNYGKVFASREEWWHGWWNQCDFVA